MKKAIIITAFALSSFGAFAQQQDTSKKINQVYYSDLQKSLQALQTLYAKIHGKSVSDEIKSGTRDSLDAIMNVVLQPIFIRVPQQKEPVKTGKP
jgi:hypothetical protein